jgi:hypothetical protein
MKATWPPRRTQWAYSQENIFRFLYLFSFYAYYVIVVKDCRITYEIKDVLYQATNDTKIKFSGIIAAKHKQIEEAKNPARFESVQSILNPFTARLLLMKIKL